MLDEMFDPLRRGSAVEQGAETRQGLGLGLFIVREITRAHGGDIEVRSDVAQTTFSVRLPRARAS
jgi:signal transduction histidine kinase